jgi:hypothetical protein
MKNIFTLLILLLTCSVGAQTSNLVIFNNGGQQFFVVLNGVKQNALPKTNVRIEGLQSAGYDVKLIFADGKTGDINKKIYLDPNLEYSTRVVIKSAKKRSLKLFDMVPLNGSNYGNSEETITYRPDNSATFSDQQITVSGQGTIQQNNSSQQQGEVVQSTQTGTGQATTATANNGSQSSQTTVNTTHTHADGTVHNAQHQPVNPPAATHTHADGTVHNDHGHQQPQAPAGNSHTHADGTVHHGNHTTGTPAQAGTQPVIDAQGVMHCNRAVADIESLISGIKAETFASDQKQYAVSELTNMCINSDQAYRIVNTFTFESDRLEIAQVCYKHLVDKTAAEKLTSLFTFDATKKEFREYMKNNK